MTKTRLQPLLDRGLTTAEPAAELGFTQQYVLNRAKFWRLDIPEEWPRRRQTEAFRDELADKYLTGRTVTSLAEEYGRSVDYLTNNLHTSFVHTGPPAVRSRARPDHVRAARRQGLTLRQIAEQTRCPLPIVIRAAASDAWADPKVWESISFGQAPDPAGEGPTP